MKADIKKFNLIFVLFFFFSIPAPCRSAEVRQPVWAGIFYPATEAALTKTIKKLISKARETGGKPVNSTQLRALILPHAGYAYSGLTAAHAALALENQKITRVILMGPDHRVGFSGIALTNLSAYETPLGRVDIDQDAEILRRRPRLFQPRPESDRTEHSIEVPLPFFQYMLPEFKLIPLVFGDVADPLTAAAALDPLLNENTLLAVSSDLSHYLEYNAAKARDNKTIDMILKLDSTGLTPFANRACGATPIAVIIELAGKHNWQPVLLHYENSGDTVNGTRDRVVGYGALAFYGDKTIMDNKNFFSREQGELLVKLARQTISARFNPGSTEEQLIKGLADPAFQEKRGTFVTLKINGQLRGCIGTISGQEPIIAGVRRNALNAAFNDFRFRPLQENELDKINIEVSILSEPQHLDYTDSADLIARLRPGVDGVILKLGSNSATFLPQVWEQLPETEAFLSHLCTKAGLGSDAWQTAKPEIEIYQVQYFNESDYNNRHP